MENSKDMKINEDGIPPMDLDFWIKINEEGMKSGFKPHKPILAEHVILCLGLGIRGLVCLLAEKMDMELDDVWENLHRAMDLARVDFDGPDDEFTEENLDLDN